MIDRLCWLVLALIHAVPAAAFLFPAMLTRLYGVAGGSEQALLLQHRAALFGAVMLVCLWAAFDPGASRIAIAVATLSMLSFLLLYALGGMPASLRGIAIGDLIGLPFLGYLAWKAFFST